MRRLFLIAMALLASGPALAQVPPGGPPQAASVPATPPAPMPTIQSPDAALAADAAAVAARLGETPDDAARDLRLQQATVPATEAIATRFADRLAGIAVDHAPFRITVVLTGDAPVPGQSITIGPDAVPVTFRTGARATQTGIMQAITAYQAAIRASLLHPPGLGVDQRTGELVVLVSDEDARREGADALRDRLGTLTGVPVRLRVIDDPTLDMAGLEGGARVIGSVPGDPHRYLCTAGFVVTDGARTGIATAAHCPDALTAHTADGRTLDLPFVTQAGWGNQDVQINTSPEPLPALIYADTAKTVSRPVTGNVPREDMRAGDVVCHRGERTGYSCSVVELTDFAPAGDLCGGPCLPTWTSVAGPTCNSGDSGAPVFLGTSAIGILKGGSYRANGSCAFWFYMSTDYLPVGWRLLTAEDMEPPPVQPAAPTPSPPATSSLATP